MEIIILIPLILAILILVFVGACQNRTFREKEKFHETQIQQMQRSFASERRAFIEKEREKEAQIQRMERAFTTEQEIRGIRKEVRNRLQTLEAQIINTLITSSEHPENWWTTLSNDAYDTFITSSKPFDYCADWWTALSTWYREQQNWKCETCHLSLHKHKDYLHTHHIWGTRLSTPEDLKALCIGCHAEERGKGHTSLKEEQKYQGFMECYGDEWRRLRK